MSAPAKSENVCTACRSRKKKCDGTRPSCASCLKRGDLCLYSALTPAIRNAVGQNTWFSTLGPGGEAHTSIEDHGGQGIWCDAAALAAVQQEWNEPSSWMNLDPVDLSSSSSLDAAADADTAVFLQGLPSPQKSASSSDAASPARRDSLPETPLFLDLVDIYFDRIYSLVPVVHKAQLRERIEKHGIDSVSSALVLAIAAVSASSHPDQAVRDRRRGWFDGAKALASKHMHTSDRGIQTLQAAALTIYQAVVETDFTTTWILLGEAWRKGVAMGCSQCDSDGQIPIIPAFGGAQQVLGQQNWVEKEEARRAIWMLYMFDRGLCFSVGLVHAIDDRRLRVNFPMPDAVFQTGTSLPSSVPEPVKFSSDLDDVITAVQGRCRRGEASMHQLLLLGYILLGSIGELLHASDFDYDRMGPRLSDMEARLVRIRLMLPSSATDLSAAAYDDFSSVLWLNFALTACTILLHHRPLRSKEQPDLLGRSPPSVATTHSAHWPHCVAAARSSVSMIRQTARSSALQPLVNAHAIPLLFFLSRILIMDYFCSPGAARRDGTAGGLAMNQHARLEEDLQVLALTFTRLRDALGPVGVKYYKGFAYWLSRGPQLARQGKPQGSLTLLQTCDKWPDVPADHEIVVPATASALAESRRDELSSSEM